MPQKWQTFFMTSRVGSKKLEVAPVKARFKFFQRLNNFYPRAVLIPGAVAQINEDVEATPRKLNQLPHTLGFVDVGSLAFMPLKMTRYVRERIVILHRAVGVFVGRIEDANLQR